MTGPEKKTAVGYVKVHKGENVLCDVCLTAQHRSLSDVRVGKSAAGVV